MCGPCSLLCDIGARSVDVGPNFQNTKHFAGSYSGVLGVTVSVAARGSESDELFPPIGLAQAERSASAMQIDVGANDEPHKS